MKQFRSVPRYIVVGALCALIANGILIGFDQLGINYAISSTVSFVVTLLIAYALHTKWTFGSERSLGGLIRYGAAMAVNLPLSITLLFVFIDLCDFRMALAAPLATIVQTAFNYAAAVALIRPKSSALTVTHFESIRAPSASRR